MRRDQKDREDKGKVKFRYFEFEMDAGDPALQDTIRNITSAIGKTSGSLGRVHDVSPRQLQHNSETSESADEHLASTPDAQTTPETENPIPQTSTRSAKQWNPRSPRVLEDLKLNKARDPLKDYIERKKPSGHNSKYLAIAGWLKDNLSLNEVTMDHIHTCYRHLGWQTPKDASAPLRAMTSQNHWFSKAQGKGAYTLNHVGENVIMDMGKGK